MMTLHIILNIYKYRENSLLFLHSKLILSAFVTVDHSKWMKFLNGLPNAQIFFTCSRSVTKSFKINKLWNSYVTSLKKDS